jgi:hypothetical protein
MKIDRRRVLGSLAAIPFIGIPFAEAETEQPISKSPSVMTTVKREHDRKWVMPEMSQLLIDTASDDHKVADKAMFTLIDALWHPICKHIVEETGIETYHAELGEWFPNHKMMEVASAIDWGVHYARTARFDVVGRAAQLFTESLIQKINAIKKPGTFITDLQLWTDPTLYKQQRRGFYGWVELEIPENDS